MKQALQDALDARGYTTLTPVQEAVLDPALDGRDMLVSAQTGSGKTLGFGLAIAPTLLAEAESFDRAEAPLALIIAPTRELALQVKRELGWLYAQAGAVLASCVGGMDMRDERRALARGAHIVAATPGRLRDHIMRGSIDLGAVRAIVLDEADEMLDLGFREDLEFILGEAPEARQTLMFSATVPKAIARLAESFQKDAARIVAKSATAQHADIDYRAMPVAERDVDNAIINTLRYFEAPNAIVFANTRAMVNRLTTRLSNRGFPVVALSGELSQAERTHALQAMRDGRAQVCVATDVAARGIDLPGLDLVIHAELPSNGETLLHRSGRTGRAGRKGVSALIVPPKARKKAQRILGGAKVKADWAPPPSADEVNARDEERMLADPAWTDPVAEGEAATVETLTTTFSAQQLAAAYLRLRRAQRSAPEELSDPDARPEPKPRREFGPSQWFAISGGRDAGAEPRRILPMLCKVGDLTKDDIGAIRVQKDVSYVQIRDDSVAGFLAAIGESMQVEDGASLTQLAEPPVLERPERTGGPAHRPKPHRGSKPGGARGPGPGGSAPDRPKPNRPRQDTSRFDTPRPAGPKADRPSTDRPKAKGPKPDKPKWDKPKADAPSRPKPQAGKPPFPKSDKPVRKGPRASDAPSGGDAPVRKPRSARPDGKPKGPPPPKGKPNSKKNRARAAAAAAAKGKGKGKPGKKG